jgi:hypothetical protein
MQTSLALTMALATFLMLALYIVVRLLCVIVPPKEHQTIMRPLVFLALLLILPLILVFLGSYAAAMGDLGSSSGDFPDDEKTPVHDVG